MAYKKHVKRDVKEECVWKPAQRMNFNLAVLLED